MALDGAVEDVRISTHNGTHMDAPWHYHPTIGRRRARDHGRRDPARVVLPARREADFRHLDDGHVVTPAEIEAELERIGHRLQALDIVVANTAAGQRYGYDDYLFRGCGFGREATLWLAERGIRVVARTHGPGTRRSRTRSSAGRGQAIRRSSGKGTRRAGTERTARSRSSGTSRAFLRQAFRSRAFPRRSRTPPPGGPEPLRLWTTSGGPAVTSRQAGPRWSVRRRSALQHRRGFSSLSPRAAACFGTAGHRRPQHFPLWPRQVQDGRCLGQFRHEVQRSGPCGVPLRAGQSLSRSDSARPRGRRPGARELGSSLRVGGISAHATAILRLRKQEKPDDRRSDSCKP